MGLGPSVFGVFCAMSLPVVPDDVDFAALRSIESNPDVQVRLITEQERFLPGEPMRAIVRLENRGTSPISIRTTEPGSFFDPMLHFLDAEGRPFPRTPLGRMYTIRRIEGAFTVVSEIPPRYVFVSLGILNDGLVLSKPGTYKLAVGATFSTKGGENVTHSRHARVARLRRNLSLENTSRNVENWNEVEYLEGRFVGAWSDLYAFAIEPDKPSAAPPESRSFRLLQENAATPIEARDRVQLEVTATPVQSGDDLSLRVTWPSGDRRPIQLLIEPRYSDSAPIVALTSIGKRHVSQAGVMGPVAVRVVPTQEKDTATVHLGRYFAIMPPAEVEFHVELNAETEQGHDSKRRFQWKSWVVGKRGWLVTVGGRRIAYDALMPLSDFRSQDAQFIVAGKEISGNTN